MCTINNMEFKDYLRFHKERIKNDYESAKKYWESFMPANYVNEWSDGHMVSTICGQLGHPVSSQSIVSERLDDLKDSPSMWHKKKRTKRDLLKKGVTYATA